MHQAAVGQGYWEIACLLIPTEDPLGRGEFGDDADEMLMVTSHRRAHRDLRTPVNRSSSTVGSEELAQTGAAKAKAKSKGKERKENVEE